jgi:hypothetical protein
MILRLHMVPEVTAPWGGGRLTVGTLEVWVEVLRGKVLRGWGRCGGKGVGLIVGVTRCEAHGWVRLDKPPVTLSVSVFSVFLRFSFFLPFPLAIPYKLGIRFPYISVWFA